MKERGILFKGAMVRALLRDVDPKTQTRRLCAVQPQYIDGLWHALYPWGDGGHGIYETESAMREEFDRLMLAHCPYGEPGDRLWVRETWAIPPGSDEPRDVAFRADLGRITTEDDRRAGRTWSPSLHMPRRFSRITLEITEVRVERLHAITEEDAKAEGVDPYDQSYCPLLADSYRGAFEALWDYINGERAPWHSNPWIWCITFRRLRP